MDKFMSYNQEICFFFLNGNATRDDRVISCLYLECLFKESKPLAGLTSVYAAMSNDSSYLERNHVNLKERDETQSTTTYLSPSDSHIANFEEF